MPKQQNKASHFTEGKCDVIDKHSFVTKMRKNPPSCRRIAHVRVALFCIFTTSSARLLSHRFQLFMQALYKLLFKHVIFHCTCNRNTSL